ncbi:nucleotide sugar dehydrogenase [bacterium]|nr:nucleotide sugar dehydrogenase [bacterium]
MKTECIGIIGLGYVGLPLMANLNRSFDVKGYDIDAQKIANLMSSVDLTDSIDNENLEKLKAKVFDQIEGLKDCSVFIITVPTPIDSNFNPDLHALELACQKVSKLLKINDLVIFESTVYPGTTEEICVPLLEESGLKYNIDFSVGYSPERVNPGDKNQTIDKIVKIVSASNPIALQKVKSIYLKVTTAGIHEAATIKIAEAAKLIENVQRDVNIALINEITKTLNQIGVDIHETLNAAATKWNFQKFVPGLVGGHCIGVDPYYLTNKAQKMGVHAELVLASRRINEGMPKYFVDRILRHSQLNRTNARINSVLLMGFTFKENCPDIRNTKMHAVYEEFCAIGAKVDIVDPICDPTDALKHYGVDVLKCVPGERYDVVFCGVGHDVFISGDFKRINEFLLKDGIVFDLKSILPNDKNILRV